VYQLADEENKKITYLEPFAEKFLAKCALAEMIGRYMVLVKSEQKLLVMRPYQIYAVKAIVDCIEQNRGNGYIWHTTGSGKTLTSFKAATLLKDNPNIEKCLFVVDRKDLDRQTREEFNRFQEKCVEENTNTEALVTKLLSTNYANKVIVTTIQKLALALSEANRRNYKARLAQLSQKRLVFIFDECHRSQFGENHRAIKDFFPRAQLFGFTGTPIFEQNAAYQTRQGEEGSYKTTDTIFEKQLHAYTITHAIDDGNVLRFHIDYFGAKTEEPATPQAVVATIIDKHDAATNARRFNAMLATASINDAIGYYQLFKEKQAEKRHQNPDYVPLNIACVFSPPAQLIAKNGDPQSQKNAADVKQIQEDLPQEKEDNQRDPEAKKAALKAIIDDYNRQYGTHHSIDEFDLYYQDVQKRIKDQKYSHQDYPHQHKIDVTIVVDMLLTGFDSRYLNTLYVDKDLRYHGLVQALSRTNRVVNGTKPNGNILDFRGQQAAVDQAITLFSGAKLDQAKEIWLVEPAHALIAHYQRAVETLGIFMQDHNLVNEPQEVYNLRGDAARIAFINNFKEVQRLKIQLDQYTDLDADQQAQIEHILPARTLQEFRSTYLETARRFRQTQQEQGDQAPPDVQQLDFELVLFASAVIDYDYIMALVARTTGLPAKQQQMTKAQVISLLSSNSNLMDEQEDLTEYINALDWGQPHPEAALRQGYLTFKIEKKAQELAALAHRHGLPTAALQTLVDRVLARMIFDGQYLTDLLAPLGLGWRDRKHKELALMHDLGPYLRKQAAGQEIPGLNAYAPE
jgi:type I restriction enzyme R subunit